MLLEVSHVKCKMYLYFTRIAVTIASNHLKLQRYSSLATVESACGLSLCVWRIQTNDISQEGMQ